MELGGFESPFTKHQDAGNRWVKLAKQIPWDTIDLLHNSENEHISTSLLSDNLEVQKNIGMTLHCCIRMNLRREQKGESTFY